MNRLARNASVVMAGFVAANLLGLLRQIIINRAFGASAQLDSYFAAFRVPDLLFNVLAGGALGSAFIPMFTGLLADEAANDKAWRLASAVLNNLLIALCAAAGAAALIAPMLVSALLAPGFDAEHQQLTAGLMRVMLISTVVFGASGLLMGIHNAHHHFLAPAIAPVVYNLGIIVGALAAKRFGIYALAWGVTLGAALHLAAQLPALIRHQPIYRPALDWGNESARQVGRLMLPRMFGLAVWQINFWVNTAIASTLPAGSLSGLTIAFQIFTFPQAAIAQAIATAVFPTLSAQAARGENESLRGTLIAALNLTLFLALPATLGLILLGKPIIALLFEGGEFTARATDLAAWALAWYGLGLVGHSIVEVVTRAFYAMKDTRTPVTVGAGAMILNVILSLAFTRLFATWSWMPHGGLALANSLATAIEMMALILILRRRLNGLGARNMLASVWRSALAALAMGAAVWGWARAASESVWLAGLGGAAAGAAVYFLFALILRSPEIRLLRRN
ncbi:MAG: murein biosynthesis integral membrane protein MurJ [Chloroflexi bacterium]|nr:murein biosynthesis integral membrane protein MurJ [Chloroflexota bacterium]